MSTLIFNVATAAEDWQMLDVATKQSLTGWIERKGVADEEKTQLEHQVKQQLQYSPLTSHITSLAVYDIERSLGSVYVTGETLVASEDDTFSYKYRSEIELLEDFWESARSYDTFVSFNGRSYALPQLLLRSLAHQISPSVDISTVRRVTQQTMPYHVDLLDEFSLYGNIKRSSLQLHCRAFGVSYPVVPSGSVAETNSRDTFAIKDLYELWSAHLAPRSWLNRTL